jgi:hypothetical protein
MPLKRVNNEFGTSFFAHKKTKLAAEKAEFGDNVAI